MDKVEPKKSFISKVEDKLKHALHGIFLPQVDQQGKEIEDYSNQEKMVVYVQLDD